MNLIDLAEPVLQVGTEATVADTVRQMSQEKLPVAAVLDRGRLLGIVTERDLASTEGGAARRALQVSELATMVETTDVGTPVIDAARLMRAQRLRHLALVDDEGMFVAMVRMRRVLLEVMDELDLKLDNLERELMADGPGG